MIVRFNVNKKGNAEYIYIINIHRIALTKEEKEEETKMTKNEWMKQIDFKYCKEETQKIIEKLKFKPATKNGEIKYYKSRIQRIIIEYPLSIGD